MTNTPEIIDQLTWEGVIGGFTAVVLALLLAVVAGWSLWRQRAAIGSGWALVFWALRLVAFSIALWMLAGPTRLLMERTTTPQSIAIFADDSASMDVVDPPEQADAVRWDLAINGDARASAVAWCDRLGVALGAAILDCQQFTAQMKEHRAPKQLASRAASLAAAIQRARDDGDQLAAALNGREAAVSDRAVRISSLLTGPIGDSLTAIQSTLAAAGHTVGEDVGVRLDELAAGLSSARRRALVLANDLAQQQATVDRLSGNIDRLTRREKAGRTLDAFEHEAGQTLTDTIHVQRYRFNRVAAPISAAGGWTNALASLPEGRSTPSSPPGVNGEPADTPDVSADAATNLSAVLQQLAEDRFSHATRLAIVLSDGRHNDANAPPPQDVAAQLSNLPIYVVPIGNSQQVRDLLLHRVEAPSVVAEKDSAVIDVIITAFDCGGQSISVVLRHEGREVDRKPLELTSDRGDYRVRFTVPAPALGWQEYIVEAEPIADEASTANNYLPVSFEVVRERIRVLLADGVPRWEYRYLNQLFRRDEHIEFDELLYYPRAHGSGSLADHPELPRSVEDWARYDVVILGDIGPRQLSVENQQSLMEYVRTRGGNLIVVAGRESMPAAYAGQPLLGLLPVELDRGVDPQRSYSLQLTEEGRLQSALLIADAPAESQLAWQEAFQRFPVFGLSEYSQPKSTAHTLIEAVSDSAGAVRSNDRREEQPAFLCWQRVGAGRVAYLAAPETYRLRWRRGDLMHHRFWGQFLRWVTAAGAGTGTDLVHLQTDHIHYAQGQPVEVTVWLKDASGRPLAGERIHAEARSFNNESVKTELTPDSEVPGRYFGTFTGLPSGGYQVVAGGPVIDELRPADGDNSEVNATITVRATEGVEMANTQCNRALLEQLAQATGGQVIPPTTIGEVLKFVSFDPQVNERVERTPLWNRWSNLGIVLGCLFTEWIVRKAKGLT